MAKAAVIEPRRTLLVHLVSLGLICSALNLSAQTNGVLREVFTGINGGSISDLTNSTKFPNSPDETYLESNFEALSNFADYYGQRMRALLLPPVTGTYTFWLASDDGGALYLSKDESPARKVQIASESSWAGPRAWNEHASQKSVPVQLTNGFRYYIEALQKEGAGGDNLAVAWQKPGDAAVANGAPPIPGTYLVPYGVGPPVITVQPANQAVVEGAAAVFSIQLSQKFGASYQWYRGATPIGNAVNSTLTLASVALADSGSQFTCRVVNPYGTTNSTAATLTVNPDLTKPTLTSVGNLGNAILLTLIFSELVEATSATNAANYSISGGINVLSAAFIADTRTIILTTTPMAGQTVYILTVNNVRDRAVTPNTILPNTQKTFTLDSTPLDISFVKPSAEPPGPSSRRGPLVISEIMYHPAARADGKNLEFIEIFNSNPFSEDLGGFRVSGEVDFTFPSNTVLSARSYLVLAASPDDLRSLYGIANLTGPYTNRLSNGSGTLRLRNRQGGIVFDVNYSGDPPWPAAADGGGHSLVLARPSLGERNPLAWSASDQVGGTPGWADVISNPYRSVLINEFLAHTDPPDQDFIELYNYNSGSLDISGCVLTDDPATNRFLFPAGTTIQPRGFISIDETQLGFRLNAEGETIYFKDPSNTRVIDAVRFAGQQNGVSTGRTPDGAAEFSRVEIKTPGSSNARARSPGVVINEIMYAPITGGEDYQFVELHNRTATPVDLGRWQIEDGVDYTIPIGTVLPANGYLVVAKNAAALMTNYPALSGANAVGNFSGTLARSGERIALSMPDLVMTTNILGTWITNTIHIVVDEVTYGTGGRWGQWSHGGGSSLELMDPRSDRRLAPNWADSDESAKSPWTTIEFTGVLDHGNGNADSLQLITLGAGEYLVDNVEVYATGGQNLVANPGFDTGIAGWVPQGNHEDSYWETGTGFNGSPCLHVRAPDHGDTGANRIRTPLTSLLNPGQTATIRARMRWLKGAPELLLRLKGNWLETTGPILKVANLGTPGSANSRWLPNAGPTITGVKTSPILPSANQAVTVVARAHDPDGMASLLLKYRIDPATNFSTVTMVNNGAGLYSATIPGQASNTLAGFHIQAFDGFTPRGFTQFPDNAPDRECLVRWGDPGQSGGFGTYRVWMTQATLDRWSKREALSNKPLDCTFVYGSWRSIYNSGGQYSGSPWHAPGFNSPIGNVCDYLFNFPGDDRLLGGTDATLQWPGNGGGDNTYQREQTAYWLAEQMGLPYCNRRSVNLFINGVRRAELFDDAQQPGGDLVEEFYPDSEDGDLHKIQIWFEFDDAASGFSAVGASLQNFTTTGGQKKLARYRWNFAKRSIQDSANNYSNLFALVDAANYGGLGANYRNQLEATVDINNWLKTYAVEHAVGNVDSFAYGGGQNMYTYKPHSDTWKMLIWDIDFAFASQAPDSDMLQGIGRSNGIDLNEPGYRRRYLQILQELANGPLTATRFNPLVDSKYSAMVASGRSVENPAGLKTYASQRRASLLALLATNAPASFTVNGGNGFTSARNYITLSGTAPIDVQTITINGIPYPVTWLTVSNWSTLVTLAEGVNNLSIQGWTASGTLSTNATISITNTAAGELPQDKIVFNEIMYHPSKANAAYVELYNSSANSAFELFGWRINGLDFVFPGSALILPNAYLLVAGNRVGFAEAYGKTVTVAGEFSGNLDNGGETLRLIKSGAAPELDVTVDEIRYDNTGPWPTAADGTDSSLQLLDWRQDTWRVANWTALPPSTNLSKATPGRANTIVRTLEPFPPLWINELQASNLTGITNRAGLRAPWIEIYNPSLNTVSLARLHLATSYTNLLQWAFPTNATIAPRQFKVVFADGLTNLSTLAELHANFTLPNSMSQLALTRLGTNGALEVLDYVNYTSLPPDRSYGSLPDAQSFRRQRFFIPTPGETNNGTSTPLSVVVNEWMADNSTTIADPADSDFEDWFEIFNYGETTADLSGFYLGTSLTNKAEFLIPDGYLVPPGGHLLVWADDEASQNSTNRSDLHANIKLDKDGDAIGIFAPDGTVIDFVSFGIQLEDSSEGRFPDGNGSTSLLTSPTPRSANWLMLPNSPPSISPIPHQSLVAGQLLLISVPATDTNLPTQQLSFALESGAPSGASIDPVTGSFSWRPLAEQAPGTYSFSVRVTDDGLPPMSATAGFTVQVGLPPKATSINPGPAGTWSLTFSTMPNITYRVEFKDNLGDSEWQVLGQPTVASGDTLTIDDPAPGSSQRFYRITVLH